MHIGICSVKAVIRILGIIKKLSGFASLITIPIPPVAAVMNGGVYRVIPPRLTGCAIRFDLTRQDVLWRMVPRFICSV